jgi:hypothetical protein
VGGSDYHMGEQHRGGRPDWSPGRSASEAGMRSDAGATHEVRKAMAGKARTALSSEHCNFCRAAVFWWYKAGVSSARETWTPILGMIRDKRKLNMRNLLLTMAISGLPIIANAHGCIKGAAVGGVVGHVAGHHAVAGAAAGCVIGHHRAKVKEREAAQSQAGSANTTGGTPSH